jgi:hypothetical protein
VLDRPELAALRVWTKRRAAPKPSTRQPPAQKFAGLARPAEPSGNLVQTTISVAKQGY